MTDTGQIPGEGLPENAGVVEQQPGVPAPDAYAFAAPSEHPPAEEDDLLLMPGAQGAWSDPQATQSGVPVPQMQPAPAVQPVQPIQPVQAVQAVQAVQPVQPVPVAQAPHAAVPAQPVQPEAAGAPEQPAPVAPAAAAAPVPPQQAPVVTVEAQAQAPVAQVQSQTPVVEVLQGPVPVAPEATAPTDLGSPEQAAAADQAAAPAVTAGQDAVAATDVVPAPELVAPTDLGSPESVAPPVPQGTAPGIQPVAEVPGVVQQPAAQAPAAESNTAEPLPADGLPVDPSQVEQADPADVAAAAGAPEQAAAGEQAVAPEQQVQPVEQVPVEQAAPAFAAAAAPSPQSSHRPLHMGPPVPNPSGGVVRSLADRGPAGVPPHPLTAQSHPGPPTLGPEYLDVPRDGTGSVSVGPQLGEIPPQAGAPWDAQPPQAEVPAQAPAAAEQAPVPAETVVPAEAQTAPAPEAEPVVAQESAPQEAVQTEAVTEPEPAAATEQPEQQPQEPQAEAPAAQQPEQLPAESTPPAADAEPEAVTEPAPAADVEPAQEGPASEAPEASEAPAAPEVTEAPEATQTPEEVEAPEAPSAPEAAEQTDAPEAIEQPAEAPQPAEGTEPNASTDPVVTAEAEPAPEPDAEPASEPAAEQTTQTPPAPAFDDAEREAVLRVMRERRDIRNGFRSDPIPHDVLLRVLEAAHTAPSVGHSQPWDFVVIRSAETRTTMHELAQRQREAYAKSLPKGRAKQFKELKVEAILETPVNIVVTADPTRGGRHTLGRHTQPQMAPYSSALAVENLWLAARAEGLGVGWVSFFDEREMVRALGLPEHLEVVAYLCVGYVDEFPEEPELAQAGWSKRRPLSWVVHEETYGRRALPGAQPQDLLQETVAGIRPLDAKALGEAWERQKRMTKPAGALGMLEIISAQLSGLSRMCPPPIPEPAAVAVFAGDHGVHAQGVTAWPQEVTGQMVANFLGGGAVCNAFASQVGAEVCVIDVGVAAELPATTGLLPRKVRAGTADFTTGPALTREEVLAAIEVGIETARDLVAAGNKALLTGEMGIANTTVSAALICVYTGSDPAEITGRGTGINDEMHARKVDVVRRALELHSPDPTDPIGVLAAVGGLEHAALVGFILGGASLRTPVVLDGVSAGAAALVARAVAPEALAACIAGHRSAEPGHVAALTKLGLRPLVDLDLRLGEGTGALLALPVIQSAARAMHEVATFDSAGVTEK
ncbi:nicotinate-nucleotide--dimethylbenzimidazole phosphoribosyltransferase [Streptomyces sp. NPDC047315]|uniref:nicotinate-nucleotide--dimethylbenzimidazole phosphoribosyltransferase n=1 Tax=Streptomyces sp. NPDC047315 TaxID=3155142 RepID=UPI0033DB6D55